jgi:hypothetical protein
LPGSSEAAHPRLRRPNGKRRGKAEAGGLKICLLAWSKKKTSLAYRIVFASLSGRELRSFLGSLTPRPSRTINRFRLTASEETSAARLSFDHEAVDRRIQPSLSAAGNPSVILVLGCE